ncbi:RagB/SusD family nutrient uptake outer membrane protein [Flavobacterium sp. 5]|uniref:RagB/SusD family nutrient uptake outer membrane protein n=1 Tax=Flavobacterium sp. 5 TaxID=2035199 RepID=UPI000C2B9764|nr:RagB/SusD family nutrient uptake outer membrane protein [Flavobacterium sp. 5]PKB15162.1 putative outer membrane starch-binding protein [Flavobacterium sp. 5]
MKNIFVQKLKLIPFLLLLFAVSCENLDLAPENQFTDSNYWTSVDKVQTLLNTAYSQMQNSSYFFYNEGLSDNAYNGRGDNAGAASLAAGIYDPSLPRLKDEWKNRYAGIKTCNLLLENIDRIPDADPKIIARMKAEARFLRAFQHFQLTTWFGAIPLISKDPSLEEALSVSRTSHAEVVKFILDELNAIVTDLPKTYNASERGKITSGAAMALKARVLLYEDRWAEVVSTTDEIIAGTYGSYSLFPSYEGVFLPQNEYNSEDILSLQYVPEFKIWGEFFDMAPLSAGARLNALAPTQELVDSYLMLNGKKINEAGSGYNENDPYVNRDPRLTGTVVYDLYDWKDADGTTRTIYIKPGSSPSAKTDEYVPGSSATSTGYYTRKYFDPQHSTSLQSGLNLILFRYADILLMNAEAKNELNQFDATSWETTIKALRKRAGFTDGAALSFDSSLNQAGLREVIRNERRSELGMEGLRIFDIRRWKIAETVLNGWAHGAKFGVSSIDNGYLRVNLRTFDPGKHYLWPVPRDERLINPNLSQNPNW